MHQNNNNPHGDSQMEQDSPAQTPTQPTDQEPSQDTIGSDNEGYLTVRNNKRHRRNGSSNTNSPQKDL